MAKWRALGYVPDSDDEDDTQIVSRSEQPVTEQYFVNTEDVESERESNHAEGKSAALSENATGETQEKDSWVAHEDEEDETKSITYKILNRSNQSGRFVAIEIENKRLNTSVHRQELEFEDVDELQRDHYRMSILPGSNTTGSSNIENEHDIPRKIASPCQLSTLMKSIPSSPLTELSSSPSPPPSLMKVTNATFKHVGDLADPSASSVQSSPERDHIANQDINLESENIRAQYTGTGMYRNLRQRNPIQLRPYALESKNYRQSLKARGIKPLRIAPVPEDNTSSPRDNSQEQDFDEAESDLPHNDDHEFQNLVSSSPIHDHDGQISPLAFDADLFQAEDEFPDLGVLIRSHPSGTAIGGVKRRKLAHEYSRKVTNTSISRTVERSENIESIGNSSLNADQDMLDVPLSPPQSGDSSPLKHVQYARSGFRFPRGLSPVTLPTPLVSSELRQKSIITEAEMGAETEARTINMMHESFDESSDNETQALEISNLSSSDNDTDRQLKQVQRKIRGVLPASWLKIDLQRQMKSTKQPEATVRARLSLSPDISGEPRGVARLINRRGKRNSDQATVIIVSDDTESDSSLQELRSPNDTQNDYEYTNTNNLNDDWEFLNMGQDDVIEDNRVDGMFSIPNRQMSRFKKKNLGQTKLLGGKRRKVHTKDLKVSNASHDTPFIQPRITDCLGKKYRKKPAFRPPRLSILDTSTRDTSTAIPPFLKIASKTARLRVDRGKHSPSRKFIRLATADDTKDAYETLQNWRKGILSPTGSPSNSADGSLHRQPLQHISGNIQPTRKLPTFPRGILDSQGPSLTPTRLRMKSQQNVRHMSWGSIDRISKHRIRKPVNLNNNNRIISAFVRKASGAQSRGHYIFKSFKCTTDSRPAALESVKGVDNRSKYGEAFQRHISYNNQHTYQPLTSNILLQRFFEEDSPRPLKRNSSDYNSGNDAQLDHTNSTQIKALVKRNKRKRQPRRMILDTPVFQQSSKSTFTDISNENQDSMMSKERDIIFGLDTFRGNYPEKFDIRPLPAGIHLHVSTFVGSGVFSRSLQPEKPKNMDSSRGFAILKHHGEIFRWGPWNETVSNEMGKVFTAIANQFTPLSSRESTVNRQYFASPTDIINYFTHHLSFHNVIDRNTCLERCRILTMRFLESINEKVEATQESNEDSKLQILTRFLSFTNQLCQISHHQTVQPSLRAQIHSLMSEIAEQTLFLALNEGFQSLPQCLDNVGHLEACEYGIKENTSSIEAIIVSHYIFRKNAESLRAFWDIVQSSITGKANSTISVQKLDRTWEKLFVILPFLEFDELGIIKPGQRFAVSNDNWSLVRELVTPVLETYIQTPGKLHPNFNLYCRTLFSRCLHLLRTWGWKRSQLIIEAFFDFFARNDLAHLNNEESNHSPLFLECLSQSPQLEASPGDCSFHIFLKILGTGVYQIRSIYSEKKMRDFIWRLMPNHGRSYPKEEMVSQKDLNALRNHHDLLSTLYWASSTAARPRLNVISNLVHLESSHREACRINIQTWFNLVRFQLSIDEDLSNLEPFATWFDDLLVQLIRQYMYARSEAEEHVNLMEAAGIRISRGFLESNISQNQQQVAASLEDALTSLRATISSTQNLAQASILITPSLVSVFNLFDSGRPQAYSSIIQVLDTVLAFVRLYTPFATKNENGFANDDSQDYGDWTAFEDIGLYDDNQQIRHVTDSSKVQHHAMFYEALKKLLSNCFGADSIPDDLLLMKVVQAWVSVAQVLVHSKIKSWDDYMAQFGQDSWSSLRQTEQTRKFTACYLAFSLEIAQDIFEEHRLFFLTSWIESLVERDSMIKFQHQFTAALLNLGSKHAILQNLPFWSEASTSRFEITKIEFSERRLSLISCILSNMRESIESASCESSPALPIMKQEYASILKAMMTAMKRNYEAFEYDSDFKHEYIAFAHRIIEFLQQHTSDIYPVDRFFTDSAAFPLPEKDPTYVVGRLRNYGLRFQDSRTPKQLSVFLQSASQRAVVDGQQDYLVGQLYTAMSSTSEQGDTERPTLCSFLVKAILPAYIQAAFSTSSGWLLALPFLVALKPVFRELLTCLDGTKPASIQGVSSIIISFLSYTQASLEFLFHNSQPLEQRSTLDALGAIYSVIKALLPALDYVARISTLVQPAFQSVGFFKALAAFIFALLQHDCDQDVQPPTLDNDVMTVSIENPYSDLYAFTLRELRDSLNRNWAFHEGRYYLTRGSSAPREIMVTGASSSYEDAKHGLLAAIADFFACLGSMPSFDEKFDVPRASSPKQSWIQSCVV